MDVRHYLPGPSVTTPKHRLLTSLGAGLGIAMTGWLCAWLANWHALASPWLVAPLGASAVLVFAVPSSPLAQPWAVIAGNTVSALVGIVCVQWLGVSPLTSGLAVGLAIWVMFALRCLHPPGGASALLVSLLGIQDFGFAIFPVFVNALALVVLGVVYHRLTRTNYPAR